jgi:DNA polymerase-3 subunit beta
MQIINSLQTANTQPMSSKQIIKLIKAAIDTKTVLPILENVYLQNDRLTVFDLRTYINVPYKSGITACVPHKTFISALEMMEQPNFSVEEKSVEKIVKCKPEVEIIFIVHITEGKRKTKETGDNPKDFPVLSFTNKDIEFKEVGTWTSREISYLEAVLPFVSEDDLRPAMTGVYASKHIAATDGHRLSWKTIEPLKESFIIPADTAKIIIGLGDKTWKIFYGRENYKEHVVFISEDGIMVGFCPIDGRFPDYQVVIPRDESLIEMTITANELRKEIKNALKFGNKNTNQVVFSLNGHAMISAQDIDFGKEYENELNAQYTFKQGNNHDEFVIAFNGKFLDDYLALIDKEAAIAKKDKEATPEQKEGKVTFNLWKPTSGALINGEYLIMPLMLNA